MSYFMIRSPTHVPLKKKLSSDVVVTGNVSNDSQVELYITFSCWNKTIMADGQSVRSRRLCFSVFKFQFSCPLAGVNQTCVFRYAPHQMFPLWRLRFAHQDFHTFFFAECVIASNTSHTVTENLHRMFRQTVAFCRHSSFTFAFLHSYNSNCFRL